MVMRVRTHHPPEVKPLDVVREEIVPAISEQQRVQRSQPRLSTHWKQLRSGVGVEQFACSKAMSGRLNWAQSGATPRCLVKCCARLRVARPEEGDAASDFVMTQLAMPWCLSWCG